MAGKLELYDILGILVPGLLLLVVVPLLFPGMSQHTGSRIYPDAFAVIALTAVAIFIGHIMQALGSLVEPLLDLTWGGRPSERALEAGLGDRYLPRDAADRIRSKLAQVVGQGATLRSLFLYAAQRAEGSGRTGRFNALYAYHRGLLVLWLVCSAALSASMAWGGLSGCTVLHKSLLALGACALLVLMWFRAKQRGLYYAREVLLTAERLLDDLERATHKADQSQITKG